MPVHTLFTLVLSGKFFSPPSPFPPPFPFPPPSPFPPSPPLPLFFGGGEEGGGEGRGGEGGGARGATAAAAAGVDPGGDGVPPRVHIFFFLWQGWRSAT